MKRGKDARAHPSPHLKYQGKAPCRCREKAAVCNPGRGLTRYRLQRYHDLTFPASRNCEKINFCYFNHPCYDSPSWLKHYLCISLDILVCVRAWSVVSDSETLWTVAHQAPLSMGFPRQEYWSGLPFPSPGDLMTQRLNPCLLHLLHWSVCSLPLHHLGSPSGYGICLLFSLPLLDFSFWLLQRAGLLWVDWWLICSCSHVNEIPIPPWTAADPTTSSCRRLSSNSSHLNLCLLRCIKGKMKKRKNRWGRILCPMSRSKYGHQRIVSSVIFWSQHVLSTKARKE